MLWLFISVACPKCSFQSFPKKCMCLKKIFLKEYIFDSKSFVLKMSKIVAILSDLPCGPRRKWSFNWLSSTSRVYRPHSAAYLGDNVSGLFEDTGHNSIWFLICFPLLPSNFLVLSGFRDPLQALLMHQRSQYFLWSHMLLTLVQAKDKNFCSCFLVLRYRGSWCEFFYLK